MKGYLKTLSSLGFKRRVIHHRDEIPPSKNYVPRPRTENISQPIENELDVFDLYFQPILYHLYYKTRTRFKKDHVKRGKNGTFTPNMLERYLVARIALGVVKYLNNDDAWADSKKSFGLLGNPFVKRVISHNLYSRINRYLNANLDRVRYLVSHTSQLYWNPYPKLSLDDNLYKWTGRGFHKQKIDAKADHSGITSWELVDSEKYLYDAIFSYTVSEKCEENEKYNTKIITELIKNLCIHMKYLLMQEH